MMGEASRLDTLFDHVYAWLATLFFFLGLAGAALFFLGVVFLAWTLLALTILGGVVVLFFASLLILAAVAFEDPDKKVPE